MTRRRKGRLAAMLLALAAVLSLAACGGPNFDALKDDLKFGDEEISDVMTTYSMKIPQNKPGKLIRSPQYAWANKNQGNAVAAAGSAKVYFVANPSAQCDALNATNSQISDDDASEGSGTWTYVSSTRSCDKQRKLSWLEKTMWTMYEQQSGDTIDWLSTSRNTLVASSGTVSTLQNSVLPMYDAWDTNVNKYLNIAQGVLIVAAAISLMVLAARIVWQIGNGSAGMDGHLLGKIGWIFLGVFMGSSAASIALTFFKQAHMTKTVVNGVPTATAGRSTPALASWTPGSGASFFVSDWVRLQVDPFLIIAAVCGVVAAGFKLITTQEGRELVPLGKAFMWAMLTSVCLAGFVNLFQGTVDTWTAGVLRSASNMMRSAWGHNTLAASEFFNLDWPIALVLTIVVWFCNLISKVFCYLRAGLLPIMVGVAPVWAAMSWMETGRQAFGKVMGWLFAFLLYKPVAALVMATGSAIMVTATDGDDSQAITLMLTVSVIVLLPAMIKLIVPAVAGSIGGGGVIPSMLGGIAGMGVMAAGGALKAGAKGAAGIAGSAKNAAPDGAKPSGMPNPSGTGQAGGQGGRPDGSAGSAPNQSHDSADYGQATGAGEGGAPDGAGTAPVPYPSGAGPSRQGSSSIDGASGPVPDGAVPSGASRAVEHAGRAVNGPVPVPAIPAGVPSKTAAGPSSDGPDGANRAATRKTKEF